MWSMAANDGKEAELDFDSKEMKGYKCTGNFEEDFAFATASLGIARHPAVKAMRRPIVDESAVAEAKTAADRGDAKGLGDEEAGSGNSSVAAAEGKSRAVVQVQNHEVDAATLATIGWCFRNGSLTDPTDVVVRNCALSGERVRELAQAVQASECSDIALRVEYNDPARRWLAPPSDATEDAEAKGAESKGADTDLGVDADTEGKATDLTDATTMPLFTEIVLTPTSNIEQLSLRGNALNDADALALARALPGAFSLRHLNLFNNCISDEGGVALAHALSLNVSLQTLSLRQNLLAGSTLSALAAILGVLSGLSVDQLAEREEQSSAIAAHNSGALADVNKARAKAGEPALPALPDLGAVTGAGDVDGDCSRVRGNRTLQGLDISYNAAIKTTDITAFADTLASAFSSRAGPDDGDEEADRPGLRHLVLGAVVAESVPNAVASLVAVGVGVA